MKKDILVLGVFALLFVASSCKKDADITSVTNDTELLDDVIDDTEAIDNDYEIEERAVLPFGITNAYSAWDTLRNDSGFGCVRPSFIGSRYLRNYSTSDNTWINIYGFGFGATKDSSTTLTFTIAKVIYPVIIRSWSDTLIAATLTGFPLDGLKRAKGKFTLSKNVTDAKGRVSLKKTSKSFSFVSYMAGFPFGSANWEIAYQQKKASKAFKFGGTGRYPVFSALDSTYTPTIGDALVISPVTDSYYTSRSGVVVETPTAVDSKGFRTITVYERNIKCTGTLQKKKYKFKNGAFVKKASETAVWTHFDR